MIFLIGGRRMIKYICISCGFESDDTDMKEDLCPYCGEKMVEKIEAATKLK
jgi:DNA-directed RNA polymerase subunit RPC12/RpoP